MKKIGLLPLIILAIILGIVAGNFFSESLVRVFITFNSIFSEFLGFMIPLIIIGLVTPAIADIGDGAGKMLVATVVIAYLDTVLAGLIGYGTGSLLFPQMIADTKGFAAEKAIELAPYFDIKIPAMIDVMSSLVFSFMMGLGIIYTHSETLHNIFDEFQDIISKVIAKVIIPLLP